MKRQNRNNISVFAFSTLFVMCCGYVSAQPPPERESPRLLVTSHRHGQSDTGLARLVIYRLPNLGNRVAVAVWIDGAVAGPISYGQTLTTVISAGQHVVSILPTPTPAWLTASHLTFHVRAGETYSFTVAGDHSGYLTLLRGSMRG